MTDFWEILGRMIADEAYRDAIFKAQVTRKANPDLLMRWAISSADYNAMRAAAATQYKGLASLMAVGELIVALTYKTFPAKITALGDAVKGVTAVPPGNPVAPAVAVPLGGRGDAFYVALGALSLDALLREGVRPDQEGQTHFSDFGLGKVDNVRAAGPGAWSDQEALTEIFNKAEHPAVENATESLCNSDGSWKDDCWGAAINWYGHKHPLASPPEL